VEFDEFRISIQPDIGKAGHWSVQVRQCPLDPLVGFSSCSQPKVTRADLDILRNPTAPPDLARLKELGQAVLSTIMAETVAMGFHISVWQAQSAGRGLRLVVSMIGDSHPTLGLGIHELPVEAAFHRQLDFLATNERTPVSRSIAVEPDRNPARVALPIRILLVGSEPSDMPPTNAAAEKDNILRALAKLIASGAVKVEVCTPPTLEQFHTKLQEGYHVVHFIGHGDFEIAGMDPNPQPHLYFEDGTARRGRHAVDAEQLYSSLSSGSVPLVVLTACSTAAQSPNGAFSRGTPFEGLAQTLMERSSGPTAVIAMQFDFESEASVIFSRALYDKLLRPECCLDSAVAAARLALSRSFGAGHRAWVTPTLYWRCKGGRAFEFLKIESQLTDAQRAELIAIDAQQGMIFEELAHILRQPPEIRLALERRRRELQDRIVKLSEEHGRILGTTLRLLGGPATVDGAIECALVLQLRIPATVGDILVTVLHDPDEFLLLDNGPGQNVAPNSVFVQTNTGNTATILVRDAGSGSDWMPGLYELAKLRFRLMNPAAKPVFQIRLADSTVVLDGAPQAMKTLDAVVFGPDLVV
jgi:CHAT domain-containing protein